MSIGTSLDLTIDPANVNLSGGVGVGMNVTGDSNKPLAMMMLGDENKPISALIKGDPNKPVSVGMAVTGDANKPVSVGMALTGDANKPLSMLLIGDSNKPLSVSLTGDAQKPITAGIEMLNLPRMTLNDIQKLMSMKISLPGHRQICFKVMGVELFQLCYGGEGKVITEPYVPKDHCAEPVCHVDTRPFPGRDQPNPTNPTEANPK